MQKYHHVLPSSEKWKVSTCVPLKKYYIDIKIVFHFKKRQKQVMDATENKKVAQFQSGYVYFPGLEQQKTF